MNFERSSPGDGENRPVAPAAEQVRVDGTKVEAVEASAEQAVSEAAAAVSVQEQAGEVASVEAAKAETLSNLKEELTGEVVAPESADELEAKIARLDAAADRNDAVRGHLELAQSVRYAESSHAKLESTVDQYASLSDEQLQAEIAKAEPKTQGVGQSVKRFFGKIATRLSGRIASTYSTPEQKAFFAMRDALRAREYRKSEGQKLQAMQAQLGESDAKLRQYEELKKSINEQGTFSEQHLVSNFTSEIPRYQADKLRAQAEGKDQPAA
jgi:O-methyltransferase involved in polyketide biosynthesis